MKASLLLVVAAIIGIAAIGITYFFGPSSRLKPAPQQYVSITPIPTPQLTPTPTKPAPTQAEAMVGTIEGSLNYPSEGIPKNLTVCAENIQTEDTICAKNQINDKKYTYGVGYKIEAPAGKYYVYAKLPGDEYQAYYSEFVTCGLSINCPSHEPIEVMVESGKNTNKVDPQDWYNR